MLYIISKKHLLWSKIWRIFEFTRFFFVVVEIDQMIHVIRMHSVKFMNERRNYMKRKNATGDRIVSEISKEMHWLNMHSRDKKKTFILETLLFRLAFAIIWKTRKRQLVPTWNLFEHKNYDK